MTDIVRPSVSSPVLPPGLDHLSMPSYPVIEPQTAPSDFAAMFQELSSCLFDIRRELQKLNPSVLARTVLKGGDGYVNTINDQFNHELTFQVGNKPVTV